MNEFTSYNENNIPKNLLTYDGATGKLFRIWIKNFFLSLITLGIYRAWAITHIRKYTFSSFMIDGSRLEYTGKGGRMFKGFAIIAVLGLVATIAFQGLLMVVFPEEFDEITRVEQASYAPEVTKPVPVAPEYSPEIYSLIDSNSEFKINECLSIYSAEKCNDLYGEYVTKKEDYVSSITSSQNIVEPELSDAAMIISQSANFIFFLFFMIFKYFATFSAFRFRLTATKWRGINGGIRGAGVIGYIRLCLFRLLLNILTLGFLIGRGDLIAQKYILQHTYIGKTKFEFEPNVKALDKVNLITLLLAIPTLGFSRFWYAAKLLNEKYNNLSLGAVKFQSRFTGGGLFAIRVTNLLIVIFTLGLGSAITIQRSLKYFTNNLTVLGHPNDLKLIQDQFKSETLGEGVENSTDMDTGDIDFGMI